MNTAKTVCTVLLSATLLAGGTALADNRCPPRPPDIALDNKEGYAQSYRVTRCYDESAGSGLTERAWERRLDREERRHARERSLRRYLDDDRYDRRLERRRDRDVVDFATGILQNALRD